MTPKLKPFKQIKKEITIDHDHRVSLRGSKIIIPTSLQKQVIKIAHEAGPPGYGELSKFLLNYRSTPHSTAKIPPACTTSV